MNNLGIAYFQAGRLEDAATQFRQAQGLWRELGQDRSADALNTLNNWAAVEARLSRPQVAIGIMEDALALRRELYGPSAAMAALMNNLGKTLNQLERHEEAIPLLREAIEMGRVHAGGETGAIALSASLGLADALSASGHPQAAWELIDGIGQDILDAYGTEHMFSAMLDISRARAHYAGGAIDGARAALAQARSALVALGPAGAGALQQLEALERGWGGQASPSE